MAEMYFNLLQSDRGFNYRWVQPPQVVYLVSTLDEYGNHNITPVTLGTCVGVNSLPSPKTSNYYYAFSVGSADVPDIPVRNAYHNLKTTGECVISYPGAELMEKIWAAALPYPPGIEEMAVAGFTPLPSQQVKPAGIRECPVNLEARVVHSLPVGDHYCLFVCQIIGASVDGNVLEKDTANPMHYGMMEIDPLFETTIIPLENKAPRMLFGKIDRQNLQRSPDEMGSSKVWMGSFTDWMEDECTRGKITVREKERILTLYRSWRENPNPAQNGQVKQELTRLLQTIVWAGKDEARISS